MRCEEQRVKNCMHRAIFQAFYKEQVLGCKPHSPTIHLREEKHCHLGQCYPWFLLVRRKPFGDHQICDSQDPNRHFTTVKQIL